MRTEIMENFEILLFHIQMSRCCEEQKEKHFILSGFHSEAHTRLEKVMKDTIVDRQIKTSTKETKEVK